MMEFEGVDKLESALSFWTEDETVYVCSLLAHSRTWGSNESM